MPQSAFLSGGLHQPGLARPTKLFTAHLSLVSGRAGQLHPDSFRRVVEAPLNALSEAMTH